MPSVLLQCLRPSRAHPSCGGLLCCPLLSHGLGRSPSGPSCVPAELLRQLLLPCFPLLMPTLGSTPFFEAYLLVGIRVMPFLWADQSVLSSSTFLLRAQLTLLVLVVASRGQLFRPPLFEIEQTDLVWFFDLAILTEFPVFLLLSALPPVCPTRLADADGYGWRDVTHQVWDSVGSRSVCSRSMLPRTSNSR